MPIWIGVGLAVAHLPRLRRAPHLRLSTMSFEAKEAFGGIMSILAVGFVTWMVFWMRRTARSMKGELHGKLDAAIALGPLALALTAAIAVGREGLETALFLWTNIQATGSIAPAHRRRRARPRHRGGARLPASTGGPSPSTWPSSSPSPAPCSSWWRRACSPTGSTTCRRPASLGRHRRTPPTTSARWYAASQLVRHPAQGRLQLLAEPDASSRSSCGSPTWSPPCPLPLGVPGRSEAPAAPRAPAPAHGRERVPPVPVRLPDPPAVLTVAGRRRAPRPDLRGTRVTA